MPLSILTNSVSLFYRLLFQQTRYISCSKGMAKSKFEYVRLFETEDRCLPNTWIVVRVDGKGFHRFSQDHDYQKPNDLRALSVMSRAAKAVMEEFKDICLAYGQSDEYSFVFRKDCQVYSRRGSKLATYVSSLFASSFVYYWPDFFPSSRPKYPPGIFYFFKIK
jgi:tRNA(His) guanylyltransferase